jgi:hypothetical protein
LDENGAAVPSVDIQVTDEGTNIVTSSKTNQAGQFTVPYLPAGTYTLAAALQGFTPYRRTGIAVAANENIRVDITLKVQTVQTSVEVSASTDQIQTDKSSVQSAVQEKLIDIIPNITGNPLYYAMLQANVQPTVNSMDRENINSFGIGIDGRRQFSAVGINGGKAFLNDIQVDGLPVMGGGYNEASVIPNTEGLAEVRVVSNTFSAEYGRGQGAISMNTKSGTNRYRGSLTYTNRNEALNANRYTDNLNAVKRAPFKVNEFGGSIGGPIIRNKLFFTSSYHYVRHNRGNTTLTQVPTALEQRGDFSQTLVRDLSGNPANVVIYDPFNVVEYKPGILQRIPYPNAATTAPNNQYGIYMAKFYPAPNREPLDFTGAQNFQAAVVQKIRRHNLNNRVDYQRGKISLYGSGGNYWADNVNPRFFGKSPLNGAPSVTRDKNPYGQVGATIVVSPSLVVDLRYGYNRINTATLGGDKEGITEYESFGVPKNVQNLIAIWGSAPYIGFGSPWTALTGGFFQTKYEWQQGHTQSGSISKMTGKWTLKFGAENRTLLSNFSDLEEASVAMPAAGFDFGGNFNFKYVNLDGSSPATENTTFLEAGYGATRLFTGAGQWWVRPGANVLPGFAQKYFAVYSQSDWRATPRLTINLGLRWDLQPGPTERFNRMASFDFTRKNAWGTMGSIVFPGVDGYPRNLWDREYSDFQPRLGAAYQMGNGFVLRGGFGLTYLPSNTGYFSGPTNYGSFMFSTGTNMLPYGTNPNGIPQRFWESTSLNVAAGANSAAPQIYGQSGNARLFGRGSGENGFRNGKAYQWNFFVERRIGSNWMASAGYSASAGRNLMLNNRPFQGDQMIDESVLQSWRQSYIASNGVNPRNDLVPNPWQPASGALIPFAGTLGQTTVPRWLTYMPYPHLFGGSLSWTNGFSDYHALIARVTHNFARRFMIDANYTWSKTLDYALTDIADGQGFYSNSGGTVMPDFKDPSNRSKRKYASSDTPHRLNFMAVAETPSLGGSRWMRALTGGWALAPVLLWQSGFPISISGAADGSINGYPDRIPGVPVEVPKEFQRWYNGTTSISLPCGSNSVPRTFTPARNTFLKFNPCAFTGRVVQLANGTYRADQFWYGYSANNFGDIRTSPWFNIDLTVRRTFRFHERYRFELSANAANVLNHTEFRGSASLGLGATTVADNLTTGLLRGYGNNSGFGAYNATTFAPRAVTINLKLSF